GGGGGGVARRLGGRRFRLCITLAALLARGAPTSAAAASTPAGAALLLGLALTRGTLGARGLPGPTGRRGRGSFLGGGCGRTPCRGNLVLAILEATDREQPTLRGLVAEAGELGISQL